MWIILLDHSSSMGQPFQAEVSDSRLVRRVAAEIKLDAAKECLLTQLGRLPESMPVVLFAFTNTTHLLAEGVASEQQRFQERLHSLKATNGTNIAAALDAAADHFANLAVSPVSTRILLISDGQSELAPAEVAAERCQALGLTIDMFVIDPTDQGKAFARRITGLAYGMWEPVTTAGELDRATEQAGTTLAQQTELAEKILERFAEEKAHIAASHPPSSRLKFTTSFPGRIDQGARYPLILYIHLDDMLEEVRRRLEASKPLLGAIPLESVSESYKPIPHGTLLRVRPRIEGIFVNPPEQNVVWCGLLEELMFWINYAGDNAEGAVCSGFIEVYSRENLIVGRIPVSVSVDAASGHTAASGAGMLQTGSMLDLIFASYAHEDEAIVRACKEVYEALGVRLFIDRDDLLSGQPWRNTIRKIIAECDLFQLYWSEISAASPHVAEEWQLAKLVADQRPGHFIRGIYWRRPMPKAPDELRESHFGFLDLVQLEVKSPVREASQGLQQPTLDIGAQLTVLPFVDKGARATSNYIRSCIGQVVSFLERLTGLRYVPPPIFLVDTFTVSAVRSVLTVDKPQDTSPKEPPEDVSWPVTFLRALGLAFHVRALEPEGLSDAERSHFYNLTDAVAEGDFEHVKEKCEGGFVAAIEETLQGQDLFTQVADDFEGICRRAREDSSLGSYKFSCKIETLFNVASEADRHRLRELLGSEGMEQFNRLSSLRRGQKLEFLARVENPDFLVIARRYELRFYDLFDLTHKSTSLSRSTDFPGYVAAFFEQWLDYAAAARDRRGDPRVEVGFAVPIAVLESAQQRLPNVTIEVRKGRRDSSNKGTGEFTFSLSISDYIRAISALKEIMLSALSSIPRPGQRVRAYYLTTVPTYGIFANAGCQVAERRLAALARDHGWPQEATLPGCHKVLVCSDAFEKFKADLVDTGETEEQARRMAENFLLSTLVHEHFHAILETGLDERGQVSRAVSDLVLWNKGKTLNEALAAWSQRHFFRDDPTMFDRISEYIRSGDYPNWPYRGADFVQHIFEANGLAGVRTLVYQLRDNPDIAQMRFDAGFIPGAS